MTNTVANGDDAAEVVKPCCLMVLTLGVTSGFILLLDHQMTICSWWFLGRVCKYVHSLDDR